ncbi:hypothetical protein [Variovorax sp. OV329]|uniref:hypothetical protein n=1 Tax=Variovorax sp. OV329 TaxID=1882825 RepID=UPI0008ED9A54|nr:hypothetical protein [Variovorax sp. OV329]SFN25250.1 hypothetical protein SAMN05444747_11990 [Variovorax sp. OV329]
MTTIFDPDATYRPMRLSAGEAMHIPVRAGTAVQVLAGSVRLLGPARWLGGSVYRAPQRLGEGEWLLLEDGGWLEMEAAAASSPGDTQLMLVEPAEPLIWLWRRLRALLQRGGRPASQQA